MADRWPVDRGGVVDHARRAGRGCGTRRPLGVPLHNLGFGFRGEPGTAVPNRPGDVAPAPRCRADRDARHVRPCLPASRANGHRTRPQAARWINVPEILTKDLIKVYRTGKSEVIALRGLDLRIADGELVAIRGPSGCGKTTFLNILGGIDRPTAGRIEVNGSNLVDLSEGGLVQYRLRQAGFVFQFFNLVPTLTAEENIELPMRLASKDGAARKARTKELLDLVGLAQRARHRPDELSGGEQQRIAIAVALANDPPLLLADEPTGELDTKTGQEILDLFRRLNQDLKKTIVVVTHDVRVSHIAHRVLEISDGKIVQGAVASAQAQ